MLCSLCQFANPAHSQRCRACGAPLGAGESEKSATPDALPAGALLIGTYAVESVLGQGGFGITYRAHDQMLDRRVAVKEFFPAGCRRQGSDVGASRGQTESDYREARGQFLAEARTLARCHHPGIVSVHTAFEANQTAYMVMELLHGQSLAQLLTARGGRLNEADAVGFIERVGAALSFVHEQNLLHRDIKPDNIMVCDDGRTMLIDFGTAREAAKGQAQNHTVVVTPGYAPLEQYAKQARRGAFTDIYSLAATLYHLLCGQMPPAASDRAMGVALRPVRELSPQASASVARAVELGLQMEIARRPQSVSEFLQALKMPAGEIRESSAMQRAILREEFARPKHDWNEGLDALGGSNAVKPPPVPPRRADEADALGGSRPGAPNAARLAEESGALKARQQLLEGFLPGEEPLNEPSPTATRPVKIAPQTPAPSPSSLASSSSSAPSQRPTRGTGIAVRKPQPSDGSAAFAWVLAIIIAGIFAIPSLLGSSGSRRSGSRPSAELVQGGTRSSDFQSPPFFSTPSPSELAATRAKQEAALPSWNAIPLLLPTASEPLPQSKETKPQSAAAPQRNYRTRDFAISFSPDGQRLAYVDGQAVARVLSVPDRRVVRTFALDKNYTSAATMLSPDNGTLAITQTGTLDNKDDHGDISRVDVWSVRSGQRLGTFKLTKADDHLWLEAVTNSGQLLLRTRESMPNKSSDFLWNLKTGERSETPLFGRGSRGVASPNGKEFVVSGGGGGLHKLDWKTGEQKFAAQMNATQSSYRATFGEKLYGFSHFSDERFSSEPLGVEAIDYSNNGQWIAGRNIAEITVFDAKLRKIKSFSIESRSQEFSISPTGQWLAASGTLPYSPGGNLLWNVKNGNKIRLQGDAGWLRNFEFSADGKQLYGVSIDQQKLRLVTWQPNSKPIAPFVDFKEASFGTTTTASPFLAAAQSGQRIAIAGEAGIEIRRLDGTSVVTLGEGGGPSVMALKFSSDGRLLSSRTQNGTVTLWNVETGESLAQMTVAELATPSTRQDESKYYSLVSARNMAFSPDNTFFVHARSADNGSAVDLWSLQGKPRRLASLFQAEAVDALAFSPDGRGFVCGGQKGTLQWYDVASRQRKTRLNNGESILDVVFASENLVVVGPTTTALYRLPTASNARFRREKQSEIPLMRGGKKDASAQWAISSDGKLLAKTVFSQGCEIWRVSDGVQMQLLFNAPVDRSQAELTSFSLAFSADATQLTTLKAPRDNREIMVETYRRAPSP